MLRFPRVIGNQSCLDVEVEAEISEFNPDAARRLCCAGRIGRTTTGWDFSEPTSRQSRTEHLPYTFEALDAALAACQRYSREAVASPEHITEPRVADDEHYSLRYLPGSLTHNRGDVNVDGL